jgi:hypothetical protein
VKQMVFRDTSLALFLCMVVCTGLCSGPRQLEAAEHPAALILYPRATAIKFDERGSTDRLSYHVSSQYPATPVIELVSTKLQRGGWEPLNYDFMNPNVPSSRLRGWQEILQGNKQPVCIHQWLGDWRDASGNIVTYGFRYKQPKCSTVALTDLEVTAWYTPADVARQEKQVLEKWKKERNQK